MSEQCFKNTQQTKHVKEHIEATIDQDNHVQSWPFPPHDKTDVAEAMATQTNKSRITPKCDGQRKALQRLDVLHEALRMADLVRASTRYEEQERKLLVHQWN